MRKYISILIVTITVFFWTIGADAAVFSSDIRVLLSTASYKSMDITIVGDYYIQEAPDFDLNSDNISIWIEGNRPVIRTDQDSFSSAKITLISNDYDGTSSYIGFYNPSYGYCTYLGNMQFSSHEGNIRAKNTLPIEYYLYGVIPYEMSNRFPIESLKAQAVCARSYAAVKCFKNRDIAYDILDTIDHQVYHGYSSKYKRAISAVTETRGQVLTNKGIIIQAFYTASNGGQTELTGNVWIENLPYYTQKNDLFDLINPESPEQKTFIPSEFNAETIQLMDFSVYEILQNRADELAGEKMTLISVVNVEAFDPIYDAPSKSYSKYKIVLTVSDGKNSVGQVTIILDSDVFIFSEDNEKGVFNARKPYLKLRSTEKGWMKGLEKNEQVYGWFLTNRRYGHGVGLSQRGAQHRATNGQDYNDILDFYYANTELMTFETVNSKTLLASEAYLLSSIGIWSDEIREEARTFLSALSLDTQELRLVSFKGQTKEDEKVVTGDYARIIYNNGASFLDLPVIISGDISGDGDITKRDVDLLQWHLLGTRPLRSAYLTAADVNHDDVVDNYDLLILIWHLNRESIIS